MGYFIAAFFIFLCSILYYKKRTMASPDILFCLEWGIISFLASLRLYTLYEVSLETWLIVLVGGICFLMGTAFGGRMIIREARCDAYDTIYGLNPFMSKKWFWIFIGSMVAYTLYDFSQSYQYLAMGYSLGQIREASVGMMEIAGYTRKTGALVEYIELIFSVIELFTVATGIEYFVSDMRYNFKMIIGVLGLEVLKSFTYGGRYGLAYIIIEIFVCYSLYKSSENYSGIILSIKTKVWIRRIVLFLLAIILVVTLVRGAEVNELIKKYYRYICGNIIFFDLHVQELDSSGFWSLSFAGLYGFWNAVLPIFNSFGFPYPQTYLDCINEIMDTQTFRRIGDDLVTNAFITPFYHLYADFRWLGVMVGMFLFGIVAGYLYKKAKYYMDGTQVVYYLIITQMIFKTLQTYPLANKEYVFVLIFMMILGGRHRKKLET